MGKRDGPPSGDRPRPQALNRSPNSRVSYRSTGAWRSRSTPIRGHRGRCCRRSRAPPRAPSPPWSPSSADGDGFVTSDAGAFPLGLPQGWNLAKKRSQKRLPSDPEIENHGCSQKEDIQVAARPAPGARCAPGEQLSRVPELWGIEAPAPSLRCLRVLRRPRGRRARGSLIHPKNRSSRSPVQPTVAARGMRTR